ncbi:MAG TPA: dihydrolipoyl dehydrogenase [Pseudomonadales bacterium]
MDARQVDIAIIGAGTAGLNAVREAEKSGKRWLLIEQGPYGTTCARVGCMPSKLLIAAADAAHEASRMPAFGLRVDGITVDGPAVMQRLRRERDRFAGAVVDSTEKLPRRNRLRGQARFIDATTLEVTPRSERDDPPVRISTTATVVATGSTSRIPGLFDAVRGRVLTSESVFEIGDLPRSLAVIGTGPVGLELGQAFARLGVRVVFFDRGEHPAPFSDPQVLESVHAVLPQELDLNMQTNLLDAAPRGDGVTLRWADADGNERSDDFERVLVAAGRPPNLEPLNLAATGLELDENGQPPWNPETTQCGNLPIFLAGDINAYRPLLHEAGDEGRISGANAARWPNVAAHERRTPLAIVFTDPQMAMVGTRYAELDLDCTAIGTMSFEYQGRARVMAANRGLIRIYGRRSDDVLIGAELFGPRVEHLAHLLAWAIQEQTPVEHLLRMPVYHPTLEEGMRTALRDLARALDAEDRCRSEDMSTSPGM